MAPLLGTSSKVKRRARGARVRVRPLSVAGVAVRRRWVLPSAATISKPTSQGRLERSGTDRGVLLEFERVMGTRMRSPSRYSERSPTSAPTDAAAGAAAAGAASAAKAVRFKPESRAKSARPCIPSPLWGSDP